MNIKTKHNKILLTKILNYLNNNKLSFYNDSYHNINYKSNKALSLKSDNTNQHYLYKNFYVEKYNDEYRDNNYKDLDNLLNTSTNILYSNNLYKLMKNLLNDDELKDINLNNIFLKKLMLFKEQAHDELQLNQFIKDFKTTKYLNDFLLNDIFIKDLVKLNINERINKAEQIFDEIESASNKKIFLNSFLKFNMNKISSKEDEIMIVNLLSNIFDKNLLLINKKREKEEIILDYKDYFKYINVSDYINIKNNSIEKMISLIELEDSVNHHQEYIKITKYSYSSIINHINDNNNKEYNKSLIINILLNTIMTFDTVFDEMISSNDKNIKFFINYTVDSDKNIFTLNCSYNKNYTSVNDINVENIKKMNFMIDTLPKTIFEYLFNLKLNKYSTNGKSSIETDNLIKNDVNLLVMKQLNEYDKLYLLNSVKNIDLKSEKKIIKL